MDDRLSEAIEGAIEGFGSPFVPFEAPTEIEVVGELLFGVDQIGRIGTGSAEDGVKERGCVSAGGAEINKIGCYENGGEKSK